MKIRRPKTSELLTYYAIALQCSLSSRIKEFEIDREYTLNVINSMMKSEYFFVIEDEGSPVGWMAASKRKASLYCSKTVLFVDSYQCILKGRKNILALLDIHDHVFEYANSAGIEMVVTNSVLNTKKTYNRILRENGWIDRESVLLRLTDHYGDSKKFRTRITIAESED